MYELAFYSVKERRVEVIVFEPHPLGWYMMHECYFGLVDKQGHPHLQRCLEENASQYPSYLAESLEELWELAHSGIAETGEIEARFHKLSRWLQQFQKGVALPSAGKPA